MTPTCGDIIAAVSSYAPRQLQESWDNSGLQVGDVTVPCTGVLLALDPTPEVVSEAVARGCNLVITHHPLLFRGLKCISGATPVERAVIEALRHGITVYSAHTSLDSAPGGVSAEMAAMIGAQVISPLQPSDSNPAAGLGVVAELPHALAAEELISRVKDAFGTHPLRCSQVPREKIKRIALCGGAGGEFIADAVAAGAQAYITAEVRYHDFVDRGKDIFIIDIGHHESESCAKNIFYRIISEKFPNFAVYNSELEKNPINYL